MQTMHAQVDNIYDLDVSYLLWPWCVALLRNAHSDSEMTSIQLSTEILITRSKRARKQPKTESHRLSHWCLKSALKKSRIEQRRR